MIQNYLGIEGLRYLPNVLNPEFQALILEAIDKYPWLTDLRRRVQHYGYKYDYRARRIDTSMYVGSLPEFGTFVAKELMGCGIIKHFPDQLIVNEYLPGQGIAPHIDCTPCFEDEIATVSLGSVYEMELTELHTNNTKKVDLELGSCLVFTGPARYRWRHGIKSRTNDGDRQRQRRISLTFRRVILGT